MQRLERITTALFMCWVVIFMVGLFKGNLAEPIQVLWGLLTYVIFALILTYFIALFAIRISHKVKQKGGEKNVKP
jgi:hypothetical protein